MGRFRIRQSPCQGTWQGDSTCPSIESPPLPVWIQTTTRPPQHVERRWTTSCCPQPSHQRGRTSTRAAVQGLSRRSQQIAPTATAIEQKFCCGVQRFYWLYFDQFCNYRSCDNFYTTICCGDPCLHRVIMRVLAESLFSGITPGFGSHKCCLGLPSGMGTWCPGQTS